MGRGMPVGLAVGDRVRLSGVVHTVIAVPGPGVRLADTGGQVSEMTVAELLSADDVEFVDGPSRRPVPAVSPLADLPEETTRRALWWERHIVEVIRGVPPDAPPGISPKPEYDPAVHSVTRREQAKAAELTAAGEPVTASAISKRRRRYETGGVVAMVDQRITKPITPFGRADARVVQALQQAISEATDESTRTATYLFWRTEQILAEAHGAGVVEMPSQRSLYRLLTKVAAGKHTTGSARTRRSLANRPDRPFSPLVAAAPGELMEIDSTPLDVLVRLDDGVVGRVEMTGLVDIATRTIPAAVLRPTTKAADASVLLARTLTPEPMRPGWAEALRMARSALPFTRLLDIDARLEHAAARPVIVPDTIVIDHGKVFVSRNFQASCRFLGISLQPCGEGTPTDKPHIERTLASCASLFAQFVAGYTGRGVEYRGRDVESQAVWSLPALQELLDEWLIAVWQNRLHDGLRDPVHPGRAFTPNEKYAALIETAGYVPVPLGGDDYIELLPGTWRTINAYGVKLNYRTYDAEALDPLRHQDSGVTEHNGRWEIHYDPYSVSTVWVRDHHRGGWIPLQWKQLHRVAAPFGELAWDHTRRGLPEATEEELADTVSALLTRANRGPEQPAKGNDGEKLTKRDRRVAARTKATAESGWPHRPPEQAASSRNDNGDEPTQTRQDSNAPDAVEHTAERMAKVIPLGVFDPYEEAKKRW
jgi:hypothetical protein